MTDTPVASAPSPGTHGACVWQVRATPIGPLLLAASERGLVHTAFHADDPTTLERSLALLGDRFDSVARQPENIAPPTRPARSEHRADRTHHADTDGTPEAVGGEHAGGRGPALATAAAELDAYFRGEVRSFTVPLDWSLTGGFNRRVLEQLFRTVPYGTTARYQDLAELVGEPGAARAVGLAMGSNPLPVIVPCHRVVESGGGIGGFGGGLETKRTLLSLEGLLPEPLF